MEDMFLRWPAVRAVTGISRTVAWRKERSGDFPKRRQLGPKSVGWLASEVQAWIQSRTLVGSQS
jgi:prophage regulatory protein